MIWWMAHLRAKNTLKYSEWKIKQLESADMSATLIS